MTLEEVQKSVMALRGVYAAIAALENQTITSKEFILKKLQYISAVKVRVGELAGEALEISKMAEGDRKSDTASEWTKRHLDYIETKKSFTAKQLDMEAEAAMRQKRRDEAAAAGTYEKLKNLRADLEAVENTLKFKGRMLYGDWKDSN
ncbi:hypothetical protein EV210_101177 [Anaerospora hongkongensis]|uniref:Uncharacterized protein n=1 Tax=Anaerospora hongkongensis TaxID=244830 RepID=A0A4R1Q2E0_9FIRM|nr:hypothetical protein [Anaerospora hongkongensis]TCL39977.1 hypothetical protein EV210_101177 [Anaerospora hongkongensis]